MEKALGRAVPQELIITPPVPGIENVLDPSVYQKTFIKLLKEFNPATTGPDPPTLPGSGDSSWADALETWATNAELRYPTKVETAAALIELRNLKPSKNGIDYLTRTHTRLCEALGLGS